jgi:hypothetical protein
MWSLSEIWKICLYSNGQMVENLMKNILGMVFIWHQNTNVHMIRP